MLPEQTARPDGSAPRTYGGWRRQRGIGLWGLSAAGTFALLAVLTLAVALAALTPRLLIYAAPPAATVLGLSVARIRGEPLALVVLRRLRWQHAVLRGYTRYQATVVSGHPAGFTLPGVLASARLLTAGDGYGGRYGIVHDQRTGLLTATLRVLPASTWLAERSDADHWVASWGSWLAGLGQVPMLRWVTVTIDTAPEQGSALADTVTASLDPGAPAAARDILGQLIQSAPAVTADVDTRVSLTFDPRTSPEPVRSLAEATAETSRLLPGLESALGGCGVSVLARLTAAEIAGVVRSAFDPPARGEVARLAAQAQAGLQSEELGWQDAGPFGAEEHSGCYRHDGGVSVTWAWLEAPRQAVTADILARLVIPGPFPKRVTMQYRPFPAATATRVLEAEVSAASFRAHYRYRTGRDETARDAADQARTRHAAAEEAAGAGVGLMSMFVTVTVASDDDLPRAVAWTEAAAGASKIRLRRMTYSQGPGFAATLPCGICPAELARRLPR
jgi:hypothetical protein